MSIQSTTKIKEEAFFHSGEEVDQAFHFDRYSYNKQIHELTAPAIADFRSLIHKYALISLAVLTALAIEGATFLFFFAYLATSSYLAISLSALFVTFFSFFLLKLYLQTKKPEHFIDLRDKFIQKSKSLINYQEGIPEHHLALANALTKFSSHLHDLEYSFYTIFKSWENINILLKRLTCWLYWKDVHQMREFLLLYSIDEHLKLVKCEPTNLEVHAALANAYVLLSSLYADPKKTESYDEERWISEARSSEEMQQKFRETAKRAIEEFKILNHYAPDDPWVHAQLAYSYHDLQMPEEEIHEYENILALRPGDQDTLFKLGMLFFQQGQNAKGLEIYEVLKRSHYKKAESLIKFYGAYAPLEPTSDVY